MAQKTNQIPSNEKSAQNTEEVREVLLLYQRLISKEEQKLEQELACEEDYTVVADGTRIVEHVGYIAGLKRGYRLVENCPNTWQPNIELNLMSCFNQINYTKNNNDVINERLAKSLWNGLSDILSIASIWLIDFADWDNVDLPKDSSGIHCSYREPIS